MKRGLTTAIGVCALIGLTFTFAASAGVGKQHAKKAEPIIIGGAIARSGPLEIFDGAVSKGAEVAIAEYNKKGGVLGRPLKIIYSDTKSDIPSATTAAAEVISKGANIVLTTCDYDYGGPAARFATSKGVFAIGCAGAVEYGRAVLGPMTFNTYPANPNEGAVHATFATSKGWKSAYILCDTSIQYTKTVCTFFKQSWKAFGGTICGEDTFVNTDPTIATQVTRMRNAAPKCDFILLSSYVPGGSNAIRQIRAGGIDTPLELAMSLDGDFWLNVVPTLSNAFVPSLGSLYGDDPRPAVNKFFKDYKKANGGKPAPLAAYPLLGHAAVDLLVAGIKKARTTDGKKLAAVFDKFKGVQTIIGPYTYTPKCHISAPHAAVMVAYQNGKPKYTGQVVNPIHIPKSIC